MATLSAEILQEMLVKYLQTTPSTLLSGPVPCSLTVTELSYRKELDLSPRAQPLDNLICTLAISGKLCSAPSMTRRTWCLLLSPGSSNSWRLGCLLLPLPLNFVKPCSWPARGRREATVLLLLATCCAIWCQSALPPWCASQHFRCLPVCSWE